MHSVMRWMVPSVRLEISCLTGFALVPERGMLFYEQEAVSCEP